MAFSEVFGALQQGVVDGQYNTWSNILTQKFHEVQKYATVSRGGAFLTYGVATNAKWWDGLDDDTRKILGDAMNEATAYENQLADQDNANGLAEIKKSNRMEFYEQTAEDSKAFQQAAEAVRQEWEPKIGKDIIDKLKAMNTKLERSRRGRGEGSSPCACTLHPSSRRLSAVRLCQCRSRRFEDLVVAVGTGARDDRDLRRRDHALHVGA